LFADNYFEFDDQQRVTLERTHAGSKTFTFSYTDNPNYPPVSRDFNFWFRKTVETLPDGSQNIVYTNDASEGMLHVLKSGSDEWYSYTRYDSEGRPFFTAESSAISGYNDAYNDL